MSRADRHIGCIAETNCLMIGYHWAASFHDRNFAREVYMEEDTRHLAHALSLMKTALDLLDNARVSEEVTAHLDLAICRLAALTTGPKWETKLALGTPKTADR